MREVPRRNALHQPCARVRLRQVELPNLVALGRRLQDLHGLLVVLHRDERPAGVCTVGGRASPHGDADADAFGDRLHRFLQRRFRAHRPELLAVDDQRRLEIRRDDFAVQRVQLGVVG